MKLKKIFISDVCDTLYFSNTTFDFIDFVLEKEKAFAKQFLLFLIKNKFSPLCILFIILNKVIGRDIAKAFALKFLSGYTREDLIEKANAFYDLVLIYKEIPYTFKELQTARQEQSAIYLLSASIDPVVSVIAERLNVSFISSTLLYDEHGISKGMLSYDTAGKKSELLQKVMSDKAVYLTIMSDNFSDKLLLQMAQRAIAVVYSEKAKQYWKDINPEYIYL
jgi:phosphoserine phosphatase